MPSHSAVFMVMRCSSSVGSVDKPGTSSLNQRYENFNSTSFFFGQAESKLRQEAQVSTLEVADIVDTVAHHSEASESQAEGKPAPFFWIDVAQSKHVGMH